jgi:Fe-S-cluster containining protein
MTNKIEIPTPVQLSIQLRAAHSLQEALRVLAQAYSIHDHYVAQFIADNNVLLACHDGCDFCCYYRVAVSAHEILIIAEHIKAKWPKKEQNALILRLDEHSRTVSDMRKEEQISTNIKCPLLKDSRCSIYSIRPLGCRRHHAQNVEGCKYLHENPKNMQDRGTCHHELFHAIGQIEEAIGAIFSACHYDTNSYELGMALHEALSSPKSFRRWIHKKKAFLYVAHQ